MTGALLLLALAGTTPQLDAPDLGAPVAARGYHLDLDLPESANEDGFLLAPLAQAGDAKTSGAKAPDLKTLPRVSTFHDETRVFWYAAGAGAVTSLATRVFLAIPAAFIFFGDGLAGAGLFGPGAAIAAIGMVALITVVDAALSALASSMVFNNMSRFYEGDWLSAFIGQLGGHALSGAVMWLTFGFGGLSLHGIESLGSIVSTTVLEGMQVFSILGAMPAVVITFLAGLALPALMGTWSMAATATPRGNYRIDPTWQPYGARVERELDRQRRRAYTATTMAVPIPGT